MKLKERFGRLIGYEFLRCKKHPSIDSHLNAVFQHYSINLVLDVGANQGQFAQRIRERGYRGRIWSFEPVEANFLRLQAIASQDPDWDVFKLALGDFSGHETINVTRSPDMCSFNKANEFGDEIFPEGLKTLYTEKVRVEKIDQFLSEQDISNAAGIFLKLDTQGFDLKVFHGANDSLPKIRAMLSEISFTPLYEDMPGYLDALREYERAGFAVSGMYPISRSKDLSLIEMDCVLINRAAVS